MAKMLRRTSNWTSGCNCGFCNRNTSRFMKGQPRERRQARAREKAAWKRETTTG